MHSTTLKREAKRAIEELSEDKIKVAVDFLQYLKRKETSETTLEILASSEIMARIADAEKSLRKNKMEDFIPWEKVKRRESTNL
jgi:hypothetical protein